MLEIVLIKRRAVAAVIEVRGRRRASLCASKRCRRARAALPFTALRQSVLYCASVLKSRAVVNHHSAHQNMSVERVSAITSLEACCANSDPNFTPTSNSGSFRSQPDIADPLKAVLRLACAMEIAFRALVAERAGPWGTLN